MPFDVAAVQQSLKAEGLDGWLLYDFHGSNPIAARLLGTAEAAKMTTRRWFYLVPATASRRRWCTRSSGGRWTRSRERRPHMPDVAARSRAHPAAGGREEDRDGIFARVRDSVYFAHRRGHDGAGAQARRRGGVVRGSGSAFEAVWDEHALVTHREASAALYRIKDRAFEMVAKRMRDGGQDDGI